MIRETYGLTVPLKSDGRSGNLLRLIRLRVSQVPAFSWAFPGVHKPGVKMPAMMNTTTVKKESLFVVIGGISSALFVPGTPEINVFPVSDSRASSFSGELSADRLCCTNPVKSFPGSTEIMIFAKYGSHLIGGQPINEPVCSFVV